MKSLMNEMIAAATADLNSKERSPFGSAVRETEKGSIVCRVMSVNSGSKNNQFTRTWYIDGKRISAVKLAAM